MVNFLEPSGPLHTCNDTALPLYTHTHTHTHTHIYIYIYTPVYIYMYTVYYRVIIQCLYGALYQANIQKSDRLIISNRHDIDLFWSLEGQK